MKLNLYTPIGDQLGYGIAGTNIAVQLEKLDTECSLFPIGGVNLSTHIYNKELQIEIDRAKFFDVNAPCVKIWHQYALADMVGKGLRVGFPIFELNKFNDIEKHHLRSCDLLLVCSEWAKNIVKENNIDVPTKVVPLGVDTEIFKPRLRTIRWCGASFSTPEYQEIYNRNRPYVFINIGKWEVRKGHDVLIEAFCSAFKSTDNVQLWMLPDNPFLNDNQRKTWERTYTSSPMGDKVKIFPRQLTQEGVASIIREADCGVFPARGEGWNLDALECMSCGLDLIVTDYAAHTEFCNGSNSTLIKIDELETAYDGIWFHGQGEWAKWGDSQHEQLITAMRNKVNNYSFKYGIKTAENFSWRHSAEQLLNALK